MNETPAPLLTTDEVARIFQVHKITVQRWVKDGTLEAVKVGGTVRYRREDVERLARPGVAS